MSDHPFHLPTPTLRRILDEELVRSTYERMTVKEAAIALGISCKTMEKVMRYHGIEARSKGTRPPGRRNGRKITRADVRKAALRAYLRTPGAGCPPNCPGRDRCLMPGRQCVLEELAR